MIPIRRLDGCISCWGRNATAWVASPLRRAPEGTTPSNPSAQIERRDHNSHNVLSVTSPAGQCHFFLQLAAFLRVNATVTAVPL